MSFTWLFQNLFLKNGTFFSIGKLGQGSHFVTPLIIYYQTSYRHISYAGPLALPNLSENFFGDCTNFRPTAFDPIVTSAKFYSWPAAFPRDLASEAPTCGAIVILTFTLSCLRRRCASAFVLRRGLLVILFLALYHYIRLGLLLAILLGRLLVVLLILL